jgi:hypothetical protein
MMREVFRKTFDRWRLFWSLDLGHRFQTRYNNHRQRRERGETSNCRRLFNLVGGPALIVAGFLFIPTPDPSYIIIVIGSWMVAGELLIIARFFDRTEVRLRRVGGWIKGQWSRWPAAAKVAVVSICVAALGYGAYLLFFGG